MGGLLLALWTVWQVQPVQIAAGARQHTRKAVHRRMHSAGLLGGLWSMAQAGCLAQTLQMVAEARLLWGEAVRREAHSTRNLAKLWPAV